MRFSTKNIFFPHTFAYIYPGLWKRRQFVTDLVNKKLYLNKICSPSKNLPLIIHISHMKTVKTKHPSLQRTKIHSLAPTLTQSFTFLVHTTHYHSLCTWILGHTQTNIHSWTNIHNIYDKHRKFVPISQYDKHAAKTKFREAFVNNNIIQTNTYKSFNKSSKMKSLNVNMLKILW